MPMQFREFFLRSYGKKVTFVIGNFFKIKSI